MGGGIETRLAKLEERFRGRRSIDADRWRGLLFSTAGQIAAAMPPGVVQAMPVDVLAKPKVAMPPASASNGLLRQPKRERPE